MGWVQFVFIFLRSLVRCQAELAAENLALRQQLAILKEKTKRPTLRPRDRVFWVWLSKFWSNWQSVLIAHCAARRSPPSLRVREHAETYNLDRVAEIVYELGTANKTAALPNSWAQGFGSP